MIRAVKSEESVIKVIFKSEEGENTDVGPHETLFTTVPKIPSQTCSKDHLSSSLNVTRGTASGMLLLHRECCRCLIRLFDGIYLRPEHGLPRGDFRGFEGKEGTSRLSLQGMTNGREVVYVNGLKVFEELEGMWTTLRTLQRATKTAVVAFAVSS